MWDVVANHERALNVSWAAPVFYASDHRGRGVITNEIVVALDENVDANDFFSHGFSSYRRLSGTHDQFIATTKQGGGLTALELANRLHDDPRVKWASPNIYAEIRNAVLPNDTLFGDQWNLDNIGQNNALVGTDAHLDEAWDTTTGDGSIVIAVLDNGVQTNHPDLNVWVNAGEIPGNGLDDDQNGWIDDINGWDFSSADNDPNPTTIHDNHGTPVAGIAGAIGNNNLGVSGAAQNVAVMPIKIATDTIGNGGGFLPLADIAEAVYYAAGRTEDGMGVWKSADILNNSWGGGLPAQALTDAFDWAAAKARDGLGAPVFAAAGNSASGFERLRLTGLAAGSTYVAEWRYVKNGSVSNGNDTAWLGQVAFPNGAVERFANAGLPAGWTSGGDAQWAVVNDHDHNHGINLFVAVAGGINHNQDSRLLSPAFVGPGDLVFDYWVSSEQAFDGLELWISANGGPPVQVFFDSGVPAVTTDVSYPASLQSTISVGASTDWDFRADYSQFGSALDIVAPSGGGFAAITTTDRTGNDGYNAIVTTIRLRTPITPASLAALLPPLH